MSVKAMSRVWDRSKAKGSELLVLLAIADYADDDGRNAWPTMQVLAAKSRMSPRGLKYAVDRLVAAGELEVEPNAERRRVTSGVMPRQFFHVVCCRRRASADPAKIADESAKFADDEPAKIADSDPAKIADPSAKIADSPIGNLRPSDRQSATAQPANGDTHIERSVTDPSRIHHSARASDDGRRAHPLDESPETSATPWSIALFDELWALYPRPGDKVQAVRAWLELDLTREQAACIVEHVRVRVRLGWVKREGIRYIPFLVNFLQRRRWTEHVADVSPAASDNGMLVMRQCAGGCGEVLEGRVVNGEWVLAPCPRCAPAGRTRDVARERASA